MKTVAEGSEWINEGNCQMPEDDDRSCIDCPVILICNEILDSNIDQSDIAVLLVNR